MEIYIDNEKFEPKKNNKKNIGKIIKEITKKIEKNQKVIRNIYFNGIRLEGSTVIDIQGSGVIEVETKSYTDLIFESLENCKIYLKTFFECYEVLNFKISDNEKIVGEDIEETHSFLTWFVDLIYLLDEVYDFSLRDEEFNEMGVVLLEEITALNEMKKENNYDTYVNRLGFRIADYLEKFESNIEYYSKIILEDEKNRRNLI
ncbi:MAG: chemotaxis protein [Fusobacterium sp.]|nr:chemotaxis protein [Fusobacterium sp.]